jgi:hypothetical protein
VLSHQDGCRSAVALLLQAALIQVSDYRLLGASGLSNTNSPCQGYSSGGFTYIHVHVYVYIYNGILHPIPAQVVDVLVPGFVSFSLPIVADVAFIIVKNFTFPFNNLLDLRSSSVHYLWNISRTFPTIM